MRSKSFGERIADVLIEEGLLLPNQLEEAIGIQKSEGGRLLKILTERQFVTDQDMVFSMGRCLNTPPVNLSRLRVPEEVMSLVPRDMAKANKLVPIARLDGKLFVAMADPTNVLAVDDLKRRVQLEIVPMIATERAVTDALSGVHGTGNMTEVMKQVSEQAVQAADSVEVHGAKREEIDLDRLAHDSEDAPVIKIVNLILAQAVKEKASDIHIEPFHNTLKLRYRIDGELMPAESPPKALQLAITSRVKILAGLDIAERLHGRGVGGRRLRPRRLLLHGGLRCRQHIGHDIAGDRRCDAAGNDRLVGRRPLRPAGTAGSAVELAEERGGCARGRGARLRGRRVAA